MTSRPLMVAAALFVLGGCTAGEDADLEPSASTTTTRTASTTPQPTATAAPRPKAGGCHRMSFEQAVAPVVSGTDVPCAKRHTAQTFHVGRLPLLRGGHLLAVDSPDVQATVADACQDRLGDYAGGSAEQRRLSMVRAVWFTPSVEEATKGADWFRCDVVALAGGKASDALARLPRRAKGLVGASERYRMCGTASPDSKAFARVPCASKHSWVAVAAVDLPGKAYPSAAAAADVMDGRCRDAAQSRSGDPLDVTWSQERPSKAQWDAGQHYGICWAPS